MTNDSGMDSEIERRHDNAIEHRRRKPKPDIRTFGKIPTNESTNNETSIEMDDISGLEVEFA